MAYPWLRRSAALALFAAAGGIFPAGAVEIGSAFSLGGQYSDNIGLQPENEEEAWVGIGSARMELRERTADVEANAMGLFEYRDYHTDLFDDEFITSIDADALWTLSPSRYFWAFEDYYRQATSDVLAPPTPTNREDTNVFSTGPEVRWRLSPATNAVAGARYGYFWFEETEADSHHFGGYGRIEHDWRPRTKVSLNGEVTNVQYREGGFGDYNRGDAFVRVEHTLPRATLEADAGGTAIRREDADDVDGFLGRLGWHFTMNSYSGLDAVVLAQYTDAGHDILDTAGRNGAIGLVEQQLSGDVYYNRHAELAYHWRGVRTSVRVAAAAREEDYEELARDRTYEEGHVHLGYEISPTLTAMLRGLHRRADYRETDVVITDRQGLLGVHYRMNSRLWAALEVGTTERDSSEHTEEYRENTGLISLTYEHSTLLE